MSNPERVNSVAKHFATRRPAFTVLADRYRSLAGPAASFSTETDGVVAGLFEGG
jgi:hypothetical protein